MTMSETAYDCHLCGECGVVCWEYEICVKCGMCETCAASDVMYADSEYDIEPYCSTCRPGQEIESEEKTKCTE
jgi:hypothetical protein